MGHMGNSEPSDIGIERERNALAEHKVLGTGWKDTLMAPQTAEFQHRQMYSKIERNRLSPYPREVDILRQLWFQTSRFADSWARRKARKDWSLACEGTPQEININIYAVVLVHCPLILAWRTTIWMSSKKPLLLSKRQNSQTKRK